MLEQLEGELSVAGLHELGYTAQATNDFADITGRYDVEQIDVVVFGGQVPPQLEAELKQQIGELNPQVIFVQGLGGIPGLTGDDAALLVPPGDPDALSAAVLSVLGARWSAAAAG